MNEFEMNEKHKHRADWLTGGKGDQPKRWKNKQKRRAYRKIKHKSSMDRKEANKKQQEKKGSQPKEEKPSR